jgi:hypothetical protein
MDMTPNTEPSGVQAIPAASNARSPHSLVGAAQSGPSVEVSGGEPTTIPITPDDDDEDEDEDEDGDEDQDHKHKDDDEDHEDKDDKGDDNDGE